MFPDVAMGAQGVWVLGGRVGNEESEELRTQEIKNARGKEREMWEGW